MKKNIFTLFVILVFASSKLFSQNYGNEWINFDLKYVKINLSAEGIYKINFDDVNSKNLFSGNLNPNNFQLFNKGVEVPLYITGSQDGLFNQGDIIYFYGTKNNASLDKTLYNNQNDLPNDEVSLFTDENFYFLTYNPNKNGLRYDIPNLSTSGLTPESFIISNHRQNFSTNYYPGEFILEGMSLSEYTKGEGYLGNTLSKGQSVNYQFNTQKFFSTSSFSNKLSFYFAGRSNASSTNTQGLNHHLRITSNNISLFDTLYRGYNTVRKTTPIVVNSNNTTISANIIDDLSAVTDFQAPGYFDLEYSRTLNLDNEKSLSFRLSDSKSQTVLNFLNSSLVIPILFEKNGTKLFLSTVTGSAPSFVLNNVNPNINYYLADLNDAKSVVLTSFSFKNINSASARNYLIVSHGSLAEGANAYNTYNQSIGINSSLVFTEDLYNEFYFGFHHPMAVRNYCKYMIERGNIKPAYLLLLGKGYENSREFMNLDLVPTMGYPGSDNMLTSGLNGSSLEPGLATGRIPAKTNEQVINYLDKLKVYRGLGNEIWRKKILQITGGKTIFEVSSFGNYQENLYQISRFESFGASRVRIFKNVVDPITENQTERIIEETKNGVGLISYLGHGSSTGTEISFGKASDHLNKLKPSIYLVNGCSTGQCFTATNALSEDYILTKDVGAVGWIGTSSEGVASYLMNASARFHENWFNKLYGSSLAIGIKEGLKLFQNRNDILNLAHTRQFIYLGDPFLKFNSPQEVDFNINNNSLFPTESNQNATSSSFNISLKVENIGKSTSDSVDVKIERRLADNSLVSLPIFKIKPIYNSDTIKFSLNNINLNVSGLNKIRVILNPNNSLSEVNTLNNTAELEVFLPGNGVKTIYPINKSILSNSSLVLKAQSENLFIKNSEYLFELDTVNSFNSPFLIKSGVVSAGVLPEWSPNILLEDKKVYFWRVRFNLPLNLGGNWINSSFTYSKDVNDGFSLGNSQQIENLTLNNVELNPLTKSLEFKNRFFETSIYTEGDEVGTPNLRRFRTTQSIDFGTLDFEGITLVAMSNKESNSFFSYPSPFNSTNGPVLVNGYTGQYKWNINDPIQVDSLIRFINQIPKGFFVIGHNGRNAAINQLSNSAKVALESFGLNKFNLINSGEPYMFWGVKGELPGSALEITADYNSSISPRLQTLQYFNSLKYPLSSGDFTTEKIGPSTDWKSLEVSFNKNNFDDLSYDIIGVTPQGIEVKLIDKSRNERINLSNISANDYPYLKFKTYISDNVEYNIPKLNYIIAEGNTFTDVSFNTDFIDQFKSKMIEEGDSLKWDIGISNLLKYKSDTISGTYTITNQNQKSITKPFSVIPSINPNESKNLKISESTIGFAGKNSIEIKLNLKNDQYPFNNIITNSYTVNKDLKESLLNVLFDGKNIINGDIVSPKPIIQILNTDENKFLLLNDTSTVDVYLKNQTSTNFKRINYSDNTLTFIPATTGEKNTSTIEFKPEQLTNGSYTLRVKSKDITGNINNNDYEIDFEVVNESTITNFYPYPNPVVNSMKFVFTLTGQKIPDKIKITIYNGSGKVVKTITKTELGSIKIGNNISDFTWDCTDEFGDRLANGVYFYKVEISDSDEDFRAKRTSGDINFKANMGKIYLIK